VAEHRFVGESSSAAVDQRSKLRFGVAARENGSAGPDGRVHS
jgi:hypothetical protein